MRRYAFQIKSKTEQNDRFSQYKKLCFSCNNKTGFKQNLKPNQTIGLVNMKKLCFSCNNKTGFKQNLKPNQTIGLVNMSMLCFSCNNKTAWATSIKVRKVSIGIQKKLGLKRLYAKNLRSPFLCFHWEILLQTSWDFFFGRLQKITDCFAWFFRTGILLL